MLPLVVWTRTARSESASLKAPFKLNVNGELVPIVRLGKVVAGMGLAVAACTLRTRVAVAVWASTNVALIGQLKMPGVSGVPEITPVPTSKLRPPGRPVTVQVVRLAESVVEIGKETGVP